MGLFHRRPFALALFSLFAAFLLVYTAVSSDILSSNTVYALFLCVLVASAVLALAFAAFAAGNKRYRVRLLTVSVALFFFFAGLLRAGGYFFFSFREAQSYVGETVTLTATITERESSSAAYARYRVTVTELADGESSKELRFDAVLAVETAGEYTLGDTIYVTAEGCALSELYVYPSYAVADGCAVGFSVREDAEDAVVVVPHDEADALSPMFRFLLAVRGFRDRLAFVLAEGNGDVGALAAAILLGDRDGLDESVTRDFGRAGISHLLAISGLHMSILIGGLALLLRRVGVPRRAISVVTILATFAFLLLTGFSMSACRAGLMLTFGALLGFLSRRPDPVTSLFFAVALVLLVMPAAVASVGLWMSFSSVLGLLLFAPSVNASLSDRRTANGSRALRILMKPVRALLSSVGISIVASFSVLPVLWLSGGEFSLLGVLTNPLTVPVMPLLLLLSAAYLVFGRVVVIGQCVLFLLRVLGTYVLSVARLVSSLPNAAVSLRYSFAGVCVAVFLVPTLLLLLLPLGKKTRGRGRSGAKGAEPTGEYKTRKRGIRARWFLLPPLAATLLYTICLAVMLSAGRSVPMPVTVCSGAGGELLTVTDGTSAVLIDLSEGYASDYREAAAAEAENGSTEWSYLVLTQYRARHVSTVPLFTRSELVRAVLLPTPEGEDEIGKAEELVERLSYEGVAYAFYERGEAVAVADTLSLTLSENDFTGDSVLPVFSLSLEGRGETLTYLSSGFLEYASTDRIEALTETSDVLVLGTFGASLDTSVTLPDAERAPKTVIVCGDAKALLFPPDVSAYSDTVFVYGASPIRLYGKDAN